MKRLFLLGVIFYSLANLVINDWPSMVNTHGLQQSGPFLALMLLDIGFAVVALIKMIGFGGLVQEDADEVSIHADDVEVPDTWFYGIFAVNLIGHAGLHAYGALEYEGAFSFYSSIWLVVEIVALFLTYVFFKHATIVAQREARRARVKSVA